MKFSRTFAAPIAVLAVCTLSILAAPASAEKQGSFAWRIADSRCGDGGDLGLGFVSAQSLIKERGKSGTNYFRLSFAVQKLINTRWKTIKTVTSTSAKFRDDRRSHEFRKAFKYEFRPIDVTPGKTDYFKVRINFRWMDKQSGKDRILKSEKESTNRCAVKFAPPPPPPPPGRMDS